MRVKSLVLLCLVSGLIASPLLGQPRPSGSLPIPEGLRRATPQAVMSRMNLDGEPLPPRVNLAEGVIYARCQGQVGSCAAWAVAQTMTIMRRMQERLPASGRNWHSPSFLYYHTMRGNDQGSSIHDNLEFARNMGIATEITFPYTTDIWLRPGTHAFREAIRYKGLYWRWIQHDDVDAWRLFLAQGHPIMVSHRVTYNFHSHREGLYCPSGTPTGTFHAVVVVGYCYADQTLLVLNSWGEHWGENGFFRIGFDTIRNTGSFVRWAAIMSPAAPNVAAPPFPTNVEASRGAYSGRVALTWNSIGNALYYEVFRLGRGGEYVSLGTTNEAAFVDSNVRQGGRYFYLVRSHTRNVSSSLSFPTEGWARDGPNAPPGIPSGLTAVQRDNTVVLRWNPVETAERYVVYFWRGADWVRVGETTEMFLVDENPAGNGNSAISYIVVAESRFGRSLPATAATVLFEFRGGRAGDDYNPGGSGNEIIYNGDFYTFPARRFADMEWAFIEGFRRSAMEFRRGFGESQQRFMQGFIGGGQ